MQRSVHAVAESTFTSGFVAGIEPSIPMRRILPLGLVRAPELRIAPRAGAGNVAAGVSDAHVEELAVGADAEPAAVMIVRTRQVLEQHDLRAGVDRVGGEVERRRHHPVLVDRRVPTRLRIVENQQVVGLEVRVRDDVEQPFFAVAVHRERARFDDGAVQGAHLDLARLERDHHAPVGQKRERRDTIVRVRVVVEITREVVVEVEQRFRITARELDDGVTVHGDAEGRSEHGSGK
jgi:hypothetical protein